MKTQNFIQKVLSNLLNFLFGDLISKIIEEKFQKTIENQNDAIQKLTSGLANHAISIMSINDLLTPKKVKEIQDPNLYEFPEKGLKIRMEKNDNDRKVFHTSLPCWKSGRSEFYVSFPFEEKIHYISYYEGNSNYYMETASDSATKFLEKIFATNCVAKIYTENAFDFTITKPGSLTWDEVIPKINEAICSLFLDVEKEDNSSEETQENKMVFLGDLVVDPENKPVYYRQDGSTWIKLNEKFHIPAVLHADGKSWIAQGKAEEIVGSEPVRLIEPEKIESVV